MSAPNTKDSKINRILRRQGEIVEKLDDIAIPASTIRVLTARAETLTRENEVLMRMVGRMTIERALQRSHDERLEPHWGNRSKA
jgi:hypothetical protein